MSVYIIGISMFVSCTTGLGVREVMVAIGLWFMSLSVSAAIKCVE